MLNIQEHAEILVQALPYIQKYEDKILVVKYGGNAMIDDKLKQAVIAQWGGLWKSICRLSKNARCSRGLRTPVYRR